MNSVKTKIRKRRKEHPKKSHDELQNARANTQWYLSEYLLIHRLLSIVQYAQRPRWETAKGRYPRTGWRLQPA